MARGQQYILVTLHVWKDEGQYVGECVELGTTTCGSTIDETFERIKEAVDVHLNCLEATGERQRYLREHGIKLRTQRPRSSKSIEVRPNVFTTTCVLPA